MTLQNNFSKVVVIGLGYIGLPTAAVLAARKLHVVGIDINKSTVDTINSGEIHIVEPELDIIVHAAVSEGYLKAKTTPEPADVFIIAVPTPFQEEYQPDLSYVKAACLSIAPVLKKGDLVILESTSPVGTTEQLSNWLADNRKDLTFPHMDGSQADIRIAYCPERVLPGHILRELVQNDRVIGGLSEACSKKAIAFYKSFIDGHCFATNARTAEMCKLTENSFRDVNIAFANELSLICEKLKINVWDLIALANHHPRVNILSPGAGVGGHCIAVDPWFIVSSAPKESHLIRTAREVNNAKPAWVIEQILLAIKEFLIANPEKTGRDVVITCFGLTFKADIDDLRESPAFEISQRIASLHKGPMYVVEPNINALPLNAKANMALVPLEKACEESNINIVLVPHREFKEKYHLINENCILIDVCGLGFIKE